MSLLAILQAAVSGDRALAIAALEAHPLLDGKHAVIVPLLDDLLTTHRQYLPHFW